MVQEPTDMENYRALKDALIYTYRQELIRRYSDESISGFKDLAGLSKAKTASLRHFFLNHLYPDVADRPARDAAFDNLGKVLASPKKMMPLMGSAISTIWKLGRQLPAAIRAGWHTLEAYLESHRLESALLKQAKIFKIELGQMQSRETLQKLMRAIPQREVLRFRRDILKLFKSLANIRLLKTTLEVMAESRSIMDKHPDLYSPDEKDGLDQGLAMLSSGFELFSLLDESEVMLVLHGIEVIEIAWYEELTG